MSALVPDFWGKSVDSQQVVALFPTPTEVDDETQKIGFTADVAMRLRSDERVQERQEVVVEDDADVDRGFAASA